MPPPPPPTSGTTSSFQDTANFEAVLARYQRNLTEYKVTGNAEMKSAVDIDKTWLDSYVASLDQKSQQQQTFIQKFMTEYQTANPDLLAMQKKLKEIREKGPVLQDAYETEKQAAKESAPEPIDYTSSYVKAGLIVGVVAVVALVGVFRPTYTR
jgi:flagellar biosynthesis chaperone FliJ